MEQLTEYVTSIDGFTELTPAVQIDCFSYFLAQVRKDDGIRPSAVKKCFDDLNLPPYSNIPLYLKSNTKKSKNKPAKYFYKNDRYYLTPTLIESVSINILGKVKKANPTNNLYPLEMFDDTRTYIKRIASQGSVCYDYGLYDASNVMMRRLLETLIIETFERKGRESEIKGKDGNFFYLKDLIDTLISDTKISISRNSKQGLKQLKNLGDLSAHNRRFLAKKSDIDNNKDSLRIVIEELLHIIDYKNWTS